jgi:hypothetical protein
LQKALSSAYLTHQISELESQVQSVDLSKGKPAPTTRLARIDDPNFPPLGSVPVPSPRGHAMRQDEVSSRPIKPIQGQGDRRDGRGRGRGGRGRGRGEGGGRFDDSDRERNLPQHHHRRRRDSSPEMSDEDDAAEQSDPRTVVLDVSGLMWAPQSVRRLVRRGWEIVLPLDSEFR